MPNDYSLHFENDPGPNSPSNQNSNTTFTNSESQVFSVEALNRLIRGQIESRFTQVWVKGELSNFKAHTSGHFYFSLKDSNSQIRAVMFRGYNSKLKFRPHDGLEVLVRGKVTVFEPRGEYQITCDTMEPVGAGALQKAFEQLKEKLKREGLFENSKKRPLPHLPRHIAIVTSPTGAAIRDILNILQRRARGIEITIVPTLVQGEAAAPALREAFKKSTLIPGVEAIIIGRGGGSIEDMWCFNDEGLARLISQSPIPVISAVGHEIDFTIADFVADVRAPTPSAAAELVIKSADEVMNRVTNLKRLLWLSINQTMKGLKQKVATLNHRLIDPQRRLQDLIQRNDDLKDRLTLAIQNFLLRRQESLRLQTKRLGTPEAMLQRKLALLESLNLRLKNTGDKLLINKKHRLERVMVKMDSLSPLKVVERGYSIVTLDARNENERSTQAKSKAVSNSVSGELIKSITQVNAGDALQIRVMDGTVHATVTGTNITDTTATGITATDKF